MPELPRTIVEAADWLRARRISALELTTALLERAQRSQDHLGAFITLTPEAARAAAQTADAELARGIDRGPLQGIPLGIKDILATVDAPTTANSRVMDPSWGAGRDATVVARLRQAGAVLVGKLGLHEYAIGAPDPATGFRIPKNPWDLARTPGGSSSGTGAAVAAGLILGGLGTDTGGSIRGPASFCGITGLKPTFGLVSKAGCVPLGYSLDHIGPMARTVRDCALMLQAMAGADAQDPSSAHVAVPDLLSTMDGSLDGVRIGIPRGYFFDAPELQDEVRQAVLGAVEAMAAAGARVVEVQLPLAPVARHAQRVIMFSEAYAYHEPDLRTRPELYGKYTRLSILQGALYSAADYVQAQRVRSLVKAEADAALSEVDVLVTPTSPSLASRLDEYTFEGFMKQPSFMGIWNLTGMPAMSVCCGFSSSGLPIGMQLVARPLDEPTLLKVGDAYQAITDWHLRTPEPTWEAQPA